MVKCGVLFEVRTELLSFGFKGLNFFRSLARKSFTSLLMTPSDINIFGSLKESVGYQTFEYDG
jgi:hypothetical protein